ncbi:TENA/THI domain-containing protein [Schizosaccharomyces japonicus yFS275]|uniref:TENA/THI domain-containing protein n=1 Tax=Schizosaccharomyces japonicus (strain yFS275 / FY16936) TaxID=402676 RepID=B6JYS4_SCHJY|nr:TENA/THI domain-containing protein [Schizosaccharomyces japonicus yFS275]EEB06692.1 TENA/THI domain-containing protein [Schizosaccharomyces japonicus yFS275]
MDAYSVELYKRYNIAPHVEACSNNATFIQKLAQGKLAASSFNKWLFDDRLFVQAGAYFVAQLYVRAEADPIIPEEAMAVIQHAYAVLGPEMAHFEAKCKERGVEMPKLPKIPTDPHEMVKTDPSAFYHLSSPNCRKYVEFVTKDVFQTPGLTASDLLYVFWITEAIYHRAFATAAASPIFQKTFQELDFVNWWGGRPFFKYVEEMAHQVQNLPYSDVTRKLLVKVTELENLFWSSAEQ